MGQVLCLPRVAVAFQTTPNGAGGEAVEFHHPDHLGTKLVTNPASGTSFEQAVLPFGTTLNAESTGSTNRRFTSYDRSASTGLDYAVNRHYDPQQGRFTQVDPAGMGMSDLENPQTLNENSFANEDVSQMEKADFANKANSKDPRLKDFFIPEFREAQIAEQWFCQRVNRQNKDDAERDK